MTSPPSILLDLDLWDAATFSERLLAARAVAGTLPVAFTFDRLSVYNLGGQVHELGAFAYGGAQFILLPGRPSAILGYDRSHPHSPTPAQAADWKITEEHNGGKLDEYLHHYMTPLRRVRISPFLMEVASTGFEYRQSGDDQADGYQRVLASSAPEFRLPTPDEWEYACGAGVRSLFRWGNETPESNSQHEKVWALHKQHNAFGLKMNSSTYDCEICQGPKFRGGDGGGSVCGGMGHFASWLPLASAFEVPGEEVEGWWIDDVRVRRVRSIEA